MRPAQQAQDKAQDASNRSKIISWFLPRPCDWPWQRQITTFAQHYCAFSPACSRIISLPSCSQNHISAHQLQADTKFAEAPSVAGSEEAVLCVLLALFTGNYVSSAEWTPSQTPFWVLKSITCGDAPFHLPLAAPAWRLPHAWVPILEEKTSFRFEGMWERRWQTLAFHSKCK